MQKSKLHILLLSLLLAVSFTLVGCKVKQEENTKKTSELYALDTIITLTAYGDNADKAISAAKDEIFRLDKLLSVTNSESDIYKLNNAKGEAVTVSDETYALLQSAKEISLATKGSFDVTIYPVLTLWGFTTGDYNVPAQDEILEALSKVSADNIVLESGNTAQLKNGAMCDLGGIAKGFIADKAAKAMTDAGLESGIISLGGNVKTIGTKPSGESWSIGIQNPDKSGYFATVKTEEASLITSGGYQRNFTENEVTYHHIIDPSTGYPSKSDAVSVTIIGGDGALCDALSTAIFIGGSDYAAKIHSKRENFEYIILTKDKEVIASKNLEGKITLSENDDFTDIIYR